MYLDRETTATAKRLEVNGSAFATRRWRQGVIGTGIPPVPASLSVRVIDITTCDLLTIQDILAHTIESPNTTNEQIGCKMPVQLTDLLKKKKYNQTSQLWKEKRLRQFVLTSYQNHVYKSKVLDIMEIAQNFLL